VLQGRGLASGWLNWAYADTPSSQDITRFSGLVSEGGDVKPWGREFRELAGHPESWLTPEPEPAESLEMDLRRATVDPAYGDEVLARYAEAWRKSRGCRLKVKAPAP
jgi:hypothetical protein